MVGLILFLVLTKITGMVLLEILEDMEDAVAVVVGETVTFLALLAIIGMVFLVILEETEDAVAVVEE